MKTLISWHGQSSMHPVVLFGVPDYREPGRTAAVRSRSIVPYENASDDIFVDLEAERT